MENYKVWLRGQIIAQEDATVNVLSPTAQFGLNVFEGIRCYWNKDEKLLYVFRLQDHISRLLESCKLLSINPPYSESELSKFLLKTLVANDFQEDAAVRMTIFGDGIGSWSSIDDFSMFIAPIKKSRLDVSNLKGLSACVSSWERINDNVLPPRAKVGANYINGRYAHLQAKKDGYDLPLFLANDSKVSEGAGACLFMLRKGKLITPDVTSSILESITRDTIIEIAEEKGLDVEERKIDRTELYLAEEVFLCGSAAEITPIVSIDHFEIGNGKVGKLTLELLTEYLDMTSGYLEEYKHYLTVVKA